MIKNCDVNNCWGCKWLINFVYKYKFLIYVKICIFEIKIIYCMLIYLKIRLD